MKTFETIKAAMEERAAERAELDPFASYVVYTGNEEFRGESMGVAFYAGKAPLEGLAKDATEEEIAERTRLLNWFMDGEPKRKTLTIHPETRKATYGWLRPYTLEKGETKARAKKTAAEKPAEEKPAEAAVAGAAS
ncbi:MAG: hypothetical protein AB7I04_18450 [Pseudomonadales bacterium]